MRIQTVNNFNQPAGPPKGDPPKDDKPEKDPFDQVDPSGNQTGFEVAYNLGRAVGGVVEGAAKATQFAHLVGSAVGFAPNGLGATGALVGGTYDVARGASIMQQSAFNRNKPGCVLGGLQVAQGVATWTSSLAPMFGAPQIVGQVASVAALGAFAGKQAYSAFVKVSTRKDDGKSHAQDQNTLSLLKSTNQFGSGISPVRVYAAIKEPMEEEGTEEAPKDKSKFFNKSLGMGQAVNQWAQNLGGIGRFWNNIDAIRGRQPGGVWGPLGIIGSTYSIATGVAQVSRSAGNQHMTDTVGGVFDIVGGIASLGASLGIGGRLAGGVAVGAWVAKTGFTIYATSKRLRGGDDDDKGDSVQEQVLKNLKHVFTGEPKELNRKETRKPDDNDNGGEDSAKEAPPSEEPSRRDDPA